MRREYGKALREMFAARMKAGLPDWRPIKTVNPWYWPGERIFVQDGHPTGWMVVVLQPSLKDHDAFHIEIGWSIHRRAPELSMRPCADAPNSEEASNRDEYLCRLGDLLPDRQLENGWVIDRRTFSADPDETLAALIERQTRLGAEQARATLAPFVEDAVNALQRYGVPYLESRLAMLAERHFQSVPGPDENGPRTA